MYPIKYPENIKMKMERQEEIDTTTLKVGGFSIPFGIIDRSSTHKKLVKV